MFKFCDTDLNFNKWWVEELKTFQGLKNFTISITSNNLNDDIYESDSNPLWSTKSKKSNKTEETMSIFSGLTDINISKISVDLHELSSLNSFLSYMSKFKETKRVSLFL